MGTSNTYESQENDNNKEIMGNDVSLIELHKEIDLIQSCVTRMAQNSFVIKTCAFTLVAAFIALTLGRLDLYIVCGISVFMLLMFWRIDAFYLKMEKLYRFKYEWTIKVRATGNRLYMYDLNPHRAETRLSGTSESSIISVMFSKPYTLMLFYGSPILAGIIAVILRIFCIF